jgi:hypothetical protein
MQLAQPGHLNEADLHNFTDLVPPVAFAVFGALIEFAEIEARKDPSPDRWPLRMPCRLQMAVSCAPATNRERKATSKTIEPDSTQPVVSSAKADGEPFWKTFLRQILSNVGTRAPVSYIEPQT